MDISQVKASNDAPFSWGTNYADAETDDFAVFLKEEDTRPEPARSETERDIRSSETDDPYDENDISDEELDDIDESEGGNELIADNASKTPTITDQNFALALAGGTTQTQTNTQLPIKGPADGAVAAGIQSTTTPTASDASQAIPQSIAGQLNPAVANGTTQANSDTTAKIGAVSTEGVQAKDPKNLSGKKLSTGSEIANSGVKNTEQLQKTASSNTIRTDTTPVANQAKPAETSQIAASSAGVAETQVIASNKNAKAAPTNTLETFRADEAASMSKKEVLSNKISEMLRASKGKISIASSAKKVTSSNATFLISGQVAVATTTPSVSTQMASTTAIGTVTEAAQQAEMPVALQPAPLAPVPTAQQISTDPSMNGNSSIQGAAVSGVEASSASATSQANAAARATAQAGSPAEQVSTQITAAFKEGTDKIKILLNPAELGRVDIKLELGHDGRIMAVIAADNQNSLDLLKQDAKILERALQDAGFETDSDSLSFSLNQQNDRDEGSQTANSNSNTEHSIDEEVAGEMPSPLLAQVYGQSSTSNLDIQV